MLNRKYRLREGSEIRIVIKKGRKTETKSLKIWVSRRPDKVIKASDICSSVVDKRAVVRNLLKRRVYEILRTRIAGKTFGASVVISIKKEAVGRTFRELAGELENVLYF